MKRRVVGRAGSVVAGIVAIGGVIMVTAGASAFPPEPRVDSIPTITDWRDISLPLDAYVPDPAAHQIVLRAEYALTKRCVEEFGFAFDVPPWDKNPAELPNGGRPTHYRRYGLLDEDHAKEMGYHSYGEIPASEATYSERALPDDYYNVFDARYGGGVLNGKTIPEGGCIGAAWRALGVDPAGTGLNLPDLLEQLGFEAWTAAKSDSRVVAAFAEWSACMASFGYHYSTPMDANNDPKWSGERASAEEIAVAVADVRCKKTTNLVGIRMAVEAAYQQRLISEHSAELNALREGYARQAALASAILADLAKP